MIQTPHRGPVQAEHLGDMGDRHARAALGSGVRQSLGQAGMAIQPADLLQTMATIRAIDAEQEQVEDDGVPENGQVANTAVDLFMDMRAGLATGTTDQL